MQFDRFSPLETHPALFVNRDELRKRLASGIRRHLEARDLRQARSWTIMGDKGVGKSIFTRAVLQDVKESHSADTLVLEVDCRHRHSWRDVLEAIGHEVVGELVELRSVGVPVSEALLDTARVGAEIARLDSAEYRVAHERLLAFQGALELKGARALLALLESEAKLSLTVSKSDLKAMEGRISLSEDRLTRELVALFHDLRESGFAVVLYLDNIDELDHDYEEADARGRVRREVEGILKLRAAPVALVVNVRTYFNGVLSREFIDRTVLKALPAEELLRLLELRLRDELPETRAQVRAKPVDGAIRELARRSPTPLAFLEWFYFLAVHDLLSSDRLEDGWTTYLETHMASLHRPAIERVIAAFKAPSLPLSREECIKACDDDLELFRQLQEQQIVLPVDFWTPRQFTLDPTLQVLHPSWG